MEEGKIVFLIIVPEFKPRAVAHQERDFVMMSM
jgi:hypothetical protein